MLKKASGQMRAKILKLVYDVGLSIRFCSYEVCMAYYTILAIYHTIAMHLDISIQLNKLILIFLGDQRTCLAYPRCRSR